MPTNEMKRNLINKSSTWMVLDIEINSSVSFVIGSKYSSIIFHVVETAHRSHFVIRVICIA